MQDLSPFPNEAPIQPLQRSPSAADGTGGARKHFSMMSLSSESSSTLCSQESHATLSKTSFHPLQECENNEQRPTKVDTRRSSLSSMAFKKKGGRSSGGRRRRKSRSAGAKATAAPPETVPKTECTPTQDKADEATIAALEAELARARAEVDAAQSKAKVLQQENACLKNEIGQFRSQEKLSAERLLTMEADLLEVKDLKARNDEAMRVEIDQLLLERNELMSRLSMLKVHAVKVNAYEETKTTGESARGTSNLLSKLTVMSTRILGSLDEENDAVSPDCLLWDSFTVPEE